MSKNRIGLVLARNWQAWQLGCTFGRSATFAVPSRIRIARKSVPLSVPADHGTNGAFIDILLDDCYRLGRFSPATAVVVDIGAHVGLFSLAARRHFPRAVIHAYEPNPTMWPFLEANLQTMDVVVHREAVSDSKGAGVLAPLEDSVHTRVELQEGGTIPYIDFAEVVQRVGGHIDVLKLDCEGGEWAILSVSEPWRQVRHLTMEFHLWAGYTILELKSRLTALGFEIHGLEYSGPDFGTLIAENGRVDHP